MFDLSGYRPVFVVLSSFILFTCLCTSSNGEWDCFNRRTWSYYGNYNTACVLTGSSLDCQPCENWTTIIGNWTNGEDLIERYRLEGNECRVAGNDTAPWCYVINTKGELRPGFCRIEPCSVHAGCRNGTGEAYRGYGHYTESGRLCMDWENATDITQYPTADLEENFCRNPDGRDRPWCYYHSPSTNETLSDYCQIDECTTDALSHFEQIPNSRFESYDDRIFEDANMTSEECALACLEEESFVCLSFKFRDVHTYNNRRCSLSAESVFTLNLARTLPHPDLYDYHHDMFFRKDKICEAFLPDFSKLPGVHCPFPLTVLLDSGRLNASYEASSYLGGYPPDQVDVETSQVWSPVNDTTGEWWQICYSERVIITGVVTRGNHEMLDGDGCWVNSFTLDYSLDGEHWWDLLNYREDVSRSLEFLANAEPTCNTTTILPSPLRARCLRIHPETWRNKICLAAEVLGCLDNDCDEAMGLSLNRIHDNHIEASSWNSDAFHSSAGARVGYIKQVGYGWIPQQSSTGEWIQVRFDDENLVKGVVTQGCHDVEAWVQSYTLSYSQELVPYRDDDGVVVEFRGNADMNTLVRNDLERPLVTRLVTIYPATWHNNICVRLEFIGCRNRVCNNRLGMESGRIPNEAIQDSSSFSRTPGFNGRLHIEMAELTLIDPSRNVPFWEARGWYARNEWLQVDLVVFHTVTGVITQGAGVQSEIDWVTSYRLAYLSINSTAVSDKWLFYKDIEGNEMILPGNFDQNTEVRNTLLRPIVTSRVRIMPYEWHRRRIRMRAEIVGCPLSGIGRVCSSEKGLQFGGKCYGSVSSDADGACRDIMAEDSRRATVKTSSIQNEITEHVTDLVFESKTQLTLGATREPGEEEWMWDDGTPVIYEQFLFDLPVSSTRKQCLALDGLARFQWTQYECESAVLRGTLCEVDIDECLSTDNGCSHECVNDDGSYHCACPVGYRLDTSRRNCIDSCAADLIPPPNSTVLNEGSSCFYVMESEKVTWKEAANQCTAFGSRLPNASDLNFLETVHDANISEVWVEDSLIIDNLCPALSLNASEILTECDNQKHFICQRQYSDLRCSDVWYENVMSHVTSASIGYIQAYSYPPTYNEYSTCNFLIKGPENMNIRLNLVVIKLREDSSAPQCQDTLDIYDVTMSNQTRRGQYCGDLNDVVVIGRSNKVFIELTMWSLTADMPSELGFEAKYDTVDCNVIDCNAVCGETVTFYGPSGSFQTKDFPSIIPPFTSCEYTITFEPGRYISLHFPDFDIERAGDSGDCVDRVSVRSPVGVLKRAMCGNTTRPLLISNSSTITVGLDTGLSRKSTGFSLEYNSTELGGCGFGRDTCAGDEYCTLSAAVFVSVNYPFPYQPNSRCRWAITTPEGSYVTIAFQQFDVISDVDDHDCIKTDYVAVYDGQIFEQDVDRLSQPPILGQFCNASPPPTTIRSSTNVVVVEFVSNGELEGDGFYAEYRATYNELEVGPTSGIEPEYTCPEGWDRFRGECYQFTSLNQTIRWNDASKFCADVGAFLVSIKTAEEMNFIHYMLTSSWFTGNNMKTYIGLTDIVEENRFRWEDGGPLSYTDWYISDRPEEPSQPNGHDQEDCSMIQLDSLQSSANWHDIACASREARQFICDRRAEANIVIPSRIGDLSTKACSHGSRRIAETCISLRLDSKDSGISLPCQPIQTATILPLSRLSYTLGLLWPHGVIPVGTYVDLQGVYNLGNQTLSPRRHDVTNQSCHVIEYDGIDWHLANNDCTIARNGSICYSVVSDLASTCRDGMFECRNAECIRSVHVCDGRPECREGEDEMNCGETQGDDNPTCPDSSFQCDMGRCISASFYCDFIVHCEDQSDEENCAYPECNESEFQCDNGQCIEAFRQCDIIRDCVDGSDEKLCQFCSGNTFQCYDGSCIPDRSVCDGSQDCPGLNVEDEQLCVLNSGGDTLRCLNGEEFDARWRCLYDFDQYGLQQGCRDVTHLRGCDDVECSGNTFKCLNSYCLPLRRRCDGVFDCPDGEDEHECESYSCPGFLRCHGERYCVTDDQICNGVKDCPDADDEMFCDITCPVGCSCDGLSLTCDSFEQWTPELAASIPVDARRIMITNVFQRYRRRRAIAEISSNRTIEDALYLTLGSYTLLLTLELPNNGIELIIPGMFINQTNLKKLDISGNNLWMLYADTFLGLNRLTELDLSANPLVVIQPRAFISLTRLPNLKLQDLELIALESETFLGLNAVEKLNLADNSIKRIETGAFSGLNYTSTLNLTGNEISQFKMDLFTGLDSIQHLSSDLFLFCCIVPGLKSCEPPEDQFSSCEDLMRSNVLRIFMWILGFSAFIGNILVIIERARERKKFRVQAFLIFNLAISDCLMGVYMLIIASADARFRDVYVFHAESWKASGMCKLAGILANLSSEVSVFILTAISVDRFLCITMPFSQKHLGRKSVRVVAAVIWIACLIYSVIPALPFPYFGERFYGRSGVCLALPLTNEKPPGWQYAMSAIFMNFIAMVIIIICYVVIYIIAKRSGSSLRTNKQMAAEIKLAVRTAVIVATDICCWLPIVILAFVSLSNSAFIPPSVYAWIAVFVLPINSSINPYLYTISTIDVRTRLETFRTGSSYFTKSTSNGRSGTFVINGNKKSLFNSSSSGERDSNRSIGMTPRKSDRLVLSDAFSLMRSKKLYMRASDVEDVSQDLSGILDKVHACALTHGSIDAHHIMIEKEKDSGKWTGSLIFTSPHFTGNGTNSPTNDDADQLLTVIAEMNDALGYGTKV